MRVCARVCRGVGVNTPIQAQCLLHQRGNTQTSWTSASPTLTGLPLSEPATSGDVPRAWVYLGRDALKCTRLSAAGDQTANFYHEQKRFKYIKVICP